MGKKNRYLLKLSGEILRGKNRSAISFEIADLFCKRIAKILKSGCQLGIVIGGGNIFRGASGEIGNYNRLTGDQIGMMATVINGLTLVERLRANGVYAVLQSGIKIEGVASLFDRDSVEGIFNKNGVVIFSGGIGNPYFSTDTTCALRALQIDAQFVFKATKVDGIYNKDPNIYKDAKKYSTITYDEIISKDLGIMDLTAILLMKKNNMKLQVFNMDDSVSLEAACKGEKVGTIVEK